MKKCSYKNKENERKNGGKNQEQGKNQESSDCYYLLGENNTPADSVSFQNLNLHYTLQ